MATSTEERLKRLARFAAYGIGALALLIVGVLAVGAMIPEDHVASASAHYAQPAEVVWEAIVDYEAFPAWRSGVDRVEALTTADGATGWIEHGPMGPMPMAIEEEASPRRLVLRIATDELPFGGTWTYELENEGGGSRLTITENGTVTNLLFRFMSRFVFGYTATMETYLVELGTKFGEQTSIGSRGS